MSSFKSLKLLPEIQQALDALKFKTPTPIQEKTIPLLVEGKDVIGNAQTGTGKTAAFCIPVLTRLIRKPERTALILVPTRELALQIDQFWKELTQFSKEMKSVVLIGGVPMEAQIKKINLKPNLIISTPGRLVDHLQRKSISLANVGILVLDEADRMLEMGFAPQLNEIEKVLSPKRQTMFFTATWDAKTHSLAKKMLPTDATRITIGEMSAAAPSVKQKLLNTTATGKRDLLLEQLSEHDGGLLVFAGTQLRVDQVADYLESYGVKVNSLHGGRSQGQRKTALREFREGKIQVLVATDVAARGIDVADIGHVINYDLPQIAEDYIHRIGRTGRAGAEGAATTFLTEADARMWKEIELLLKKGGSTIPKPMQAKQKRAANAEDLGPEITIERPAARKPTRSHPKSRRDQQWEKGSVQIKPEEQQRIKSKR